MNRFLQHHRDDIRFDYSCFDRMILHGSIRSFQHTACGGTVRWFLRERRHLTSSRAAFAGIANEYHDWIDQYAADRHLDILQPQQDTDLLKVSREDLVEPYFQNLGQREGVAVILKLREPERIACYRAQTNDIAILRRNVLLYYFYLNDRDCGRMFLRICPYFPFNITVWLNGHNWLKRQLDNEAIAYQTCDNLFTACQRPERLQQLSDAFAPGHIVQAVHAWMERLLPFFSADERQQGYRHQLYMTQIEYCHNLVFEKRKTLNRLCDRLFDANRGLGHPDKLAVIFGRVNYVPDTRTGETAIKYTKLHLPVLKASYQHTVLKQYGKDAGHQTGVAALRTEGSCFQLKDLSVRKHLDNLPKIRTVLHRANQRCLDVEQDVLTSYLDRGQLDQLRQPTVSPSGRRTPGLRLDDPRLLALLQAVLCFAYLVGKGSFRTKDLLLDAQLALDHPHYTPNQLRYDLSKLRGKGLVARIAGTQAYEVTPEGYRIGILHLKLYKHLYAPLVAAIRAPEPGDNVLLSNRQTKLDRLYKKVDEAIAQLATHVGIAA
jgi:hypothetical protein